MPAMSGFLSGQGAARLVVCCRHPKAGGGTAVSVRVVTGALPVRAHLADPPFTAFFFSSSCFAFCFCGILLHLTRHRLPSFDSGPALRIGTLLQISFLRPEGRFSAVNG